MAVIQCRTASTRGTQIGYKCVLRTYIIHKIWNGHKEITSNRNWFVLVQGKSPLCCFPSIELRIGSYRCHLAITSLPSLHFELPPASSPQLSHSLGSTCTLAEISMVNKHGYKNATSNLNFRISTPTIHLLPLIYQNISQYSAK